MLWSALHAQEVRGGGSVLCEKRPCERRRRAGGSHWVERRAGCSHWGVGVAGLNMMSFAPVVLLWCCWGCGAVFNDSADYVPVLFRVKSSL